MRIDHESHGRQSQKCRVKLPCDFPHFCTDCDNPAIHSALSIGVRGNPKAILVDYCQHERAKSAQELALQYCKGFSTCASSIMHAMHNFVGLWHGIICNFDSINR